MSLAGRASTGEADRAGLFLLLGRLLDYPDPELLRDRPAVVEAARELPASRASNALRPFLSGWAERSAAELEAEYVQTFDLSADTSLHLTYHLHGDRRERAGAFLRLAQLYRAGGWEASTGELPDYLPLMLEFAALAPGGLGRAVLAEHRPALELLRRRLVAAGSPYQHVVRAVLLALPRLGHRDRGLVAKLLAEEPSAELVGREPFALPAFALHDRGPQARGRP